MESSPLAVGRAAIAFLLAGAAVTAVDAGPRQSMPRGGGGGYRASAPAYRGGAPRGTAAVRAQPVPRATVSGRAYLPPRGTANGIARYGYGYGYGYGYPYYGYPYWGVGCGWWGAGWYGGGWWGWPGYGYAAYGPWYGGWYGPYDAYIAPVDAPPPTGPAIVETDVTPQKAGVLLDGEAVGYASDYNGRWDELTVAPGTHTLTFQMKGYRSLVVELDAKPHGKYVFDDALVPGEGEDRRTLPAAAPAPAAAPTPAPAHEPHPAASSRAIGRLRVMAQPPDAAVYLDGEYLGLGAELSRIHGSLAVPVGVHRIEAVRPGYVSASRSIDVGETDVVSVELILPPAR